MKKIMKLFIGYAALAGVMGFILSFSMNYFILSVPSNELSNAVGNGISGLLAGFFGGLLSLITYFKALKKQQG